MIYDGQNYYILKSGNKVYAHNGIIGLDPDAEFISEGYDGGICGFKDDEYCYTKDDLMEISDFMILQWKNFKEKVTNSH
jgi:hypothetical protein